MFCSSYVKNSTGNLIGIALNLQIALNIIVILTILILLIQEHGISFHLCYLVIFDFFHQCLTVFRVQVFCLLRQVYYQVFPSFDEMENSFSFIVSVEKCNRLLCVNFVSYNVTKFIDELQQLSSSIFRIFYVQYHAICKQ